ncbi:MAG: LamG-like jellyroll fold domain-containing protein [Crocosphaera sp.]
MSHSKENLVLHLKLDKIIEDGGQKKVIDDSDKAHDCEVKGTLKVVQDEVFGRCISFDGNRHNYIEVPDSPDLQIAGDITVEAWVYMTKNINGDIDIDDIDIEAGRSYVRIVGKGTADKINYSLWCRHKRGFFLQDYVGGSSSTTIGANLPAIRENGPEKGAMKLLNKWYHLTGVFDKTNDQAHFYLDGKHVESRSQRNKLPITSSDSLTIGYAGDDFDDKIGLGIHTGKIAHVRIYNKALSPEEIQQDREEDLRAIASFDRTESLVLNLKLDEIIKEGNERKVIDALTGRKYNVLGNPEIVIDDKLGGCLSFDGEGDYVELIAADQLSLKNSSFTVEAWINIEELKIHDQSILGNDEASQNNSLHLIIRQKKPYLGFFANDTPGKTELADNNWYHITWRYDKSSQEQAIFVNGVLDNSETGHTPFQGNGIVRIGRWASGNYFKGKIANVRIYNRALYPEEIKQDMEDDLSAIASFNKTYPLDFNLYEGEDKEPVIFIENGTRGQELTLEIVNNSDRPITLPPLSGDVSEASEANHHFELRFRPDTLSSDSLQQLVLAEKKGWSMSAPVIQADRTMDSPVTQADGIVVSLYFLATNNQTLAGNSTATLTLQHINGAAAGGARTTRVELICPQFTYHGELVHHYYREKRLSIISHRGKKHIPLHVGFVESNRILNDWKYDQNKEGTGSENELILRITNVLKGESIPFKPASKGDEASKFIISFDIDSDWALGKKTEVATITVEYEKKEIKNSAKEGESPEWIIDFDKETAIKAGEHLQITLSGIISSLPSGHANLYLRYENIPGYWDGTFVCTIEKSPILYNKNGNVGIGTIPSENKPQYTLDVRGTIYRGGNPLIYENYEIYLRGSAYESTEGNNTYLKIANVLIPMTNNTGLNTVILNPDGSDKKRTSHDVYNDVNQWNAWATWINDANNVANGDVVAVASYDAIWNAPSEGSAQTLLRSINALKAFAVEQGDAAQPRFPYALLFIKGKTGAIEVAQPYRGFNAHIKTTYYELFNYGNSSVVLRGMIMMWSGSKDHIPVGWALCDGTNGTPDLRDRFIVSTGDNFGVGKKWGSEGGNAEVTLELEHIPSHNHSGSSTTNAGRHDHGRMFDTGGGRGNPGLGAGNMPKIGGELQISVYADILAYTNPGGDHTHAVNIASQGGNQAHENLPPYYALCLIMKL